MRGSLQYWLFCDWSVSLSIVPSCCHGFLKDYRFPRCFTFFPPIGFPATCSLARHCHSSYTAVPEVASGLLVAESSGHALNSVLLNLSVAFDIVAIPSCCDCPRLASETHSVSVWSLWGHSLLSFGIVLGDSAGTSWALPGWPWPPLPVTEQKGIVIVLQFLSTQWVRLKLNSDYSAWWAELGEPHHACPWIWSGHLAGTGVGVGQGSLPRGDVAWI